MWEMVHTRNMQRHCMLMHIYKRQNALRNRETVRPFELCISSVSKTEKNIDIVFEIELLYETLTS